MRTAPEREGSGLVAIEIVLVGALEDFRVSVGSSYQKNDAGLGRDGDLVDFYIFEQEAHQELGGIVVAQGFFDPVGNLGLIRAYLLSFAGVQRKPVECISEELGSRLVARDNQQIAEREQFLLIQDVVLRNHGDHRGQEIFAWVRAKLFDVALKILPDFSEGDARRWGKIIFALFSVDENIR